MHARAPAAASAARLGRAAPRGRCCRARRSPLQAAVRPSPRCAAPSSEDAAWEPAAVSPAAAPLQPPAAWPGARRAVAGLAAAAVAVSSLLSPLQAAALDSKTVGTCVVSSCQTQLAACLADEKCAENLICLNRCNNTKDEAGCQIRCGDLYADAVVKNFNTCAVTTKKCVPQRADQGQYPIPPAEALVTAFNTADFTGRWYISAGLNPLFDTFDCQAHFFTSPEPGKLFARINWRVNRPNGQFYERTDLQRFVQDPESPALLLNHGNETLHYQDDWYIAAFKPEAYALVYYRGRNDAWDGYGGAVLYTRAPTVDSAFVPELSAAAAKLGLRWSDFRETDNTCGPAPPLEVTRPADLDTLADDVRALEGAAEAEVEVIEAELENSLVSFSRGFTLLKGGEEAAQKFLSREQRAIKEEIARAEAVLGEMERAAAAEAQQVASGPLQLLQRALGLVRK